MHRKRAYGAPVDVFAFGVVRRWVGGRGRGRGLPYISRLQPCISRLQPYISRLQPYYLQVLRKLLSRVQAAPSKGSLLRRICMPAGSQRRLGRGHSHSSQPPPPEPRTPMAPGGALRTLEAVVAVVPLSAQWEVAARSPGPGTKVAGSAPVDHAGPN